MERNDYQVERMSDGVLLNRENVGFTSYGPFFTEGLCAADPNNPKNPRTRGWYNENVIKPMIAKGEIDDGSKRPFDDRKLRYSGSQQRSTSVEPRGWINVNLGITNYRAFLADLNRSDEENLILQARGEEIFGDKYAFFSRATGIAILPLFMDVNKQQNVTYVGERTNKEAGGFLNAVAGHLKYKDNPTDVNIDEDAFRELEEEFGLPKNAIIGGPMFVGLYSHPIKGDSDFTFIVQTDVPASYVDSGEWMNRVKEREHKPLIKLASMAEVKRLLDESVVPDGRKFPLMYSTRGALESLTEAELRRL